MIVELPDGVTVHAQGLLGLVPPTQSPQPDYAVYLDERWASDPTVTWPYRLISWPDFGLPDDVGELFAVIRDIHTRAQAGEVVQIACYGGLGRTGTVLSCLAVCAGLQSSEAVEWVRATYDRRAVETDAQIQLVESFANTV